MSRKLDAAIAEALGYETFVDFQDWKSKGMPHIAEWSEVVEYPAHWHEDHETSVCALNYSSDGNAMLELDQEMRERGWRLSLNLVGEVGVGSDEYTVAHYSKGMEDCSGHANKAPHSEPLARALAAYKALTGKDWKE